MTEMKKHIYDENNGLWLSIPREIEQVFRRD